MKELSGKYSIKEMARVLKVSRQGYYVCRKGSETIRKREDKVLKNIIYDKFVDSHQTYGSARISSCLKDAGYFCGKYRTSRLMKELGLIARAKRKFKVTTDSKHDKPVAENVLDRDFTAESPNRKWVGDITYIRTRERWLYFAVVIDLFSRKVVGWAVSKRINRELVINAFKMAVRNRRPCSGLIFHSDRGSQYCSKDFVKELKKIKAVQSMSRRGNCWDNAVAESFFHTIKVERLYNLIFLTRKSAEICIFEYIALFYNRKRKHSYLKYLSPDEFESEHRFEELRNCA